MIIFLFVRSFICVKSLNFVLQNYQKESYMKKTLLYLSLVLSLMVIGVGCAWGQKTSYTVALPFSFDDVKGKLPSGTLNNLGTDYEGVQKLKFDDTGVYLIIHIKDAPGALSYKLRGWLFKNGIFEVLESVDGDNYDVVAQYTSLNNDASEQYSNALKSTTRYIKFLYTSKSNGNVALGQISITNTPISESLTISLNSACHDEDGLVYGTFSSSKPFKVSESITVAEVGVNEEGLVVEAYETGATVPANTGVMVSASDGGNYTVEVSNEQGTSVLDTSNCLRPSGDSGITAADMAQKDPNCTYYRLTMHDGTQLGYWWGAEEGAAFAVAANKAYLAVPKSATPSAGVKSNLWFSRSETVLDAIRAKVQDGDIYTLSGQRVTSASKGLYIKNGKKYLAK